MDDDDDAPSTPPTVSVARLPTPDGAPPWFALIERAPASLHRVLLTDGDGAWTTSAGVGPPAGVDDAWVDRADAALHGRTPGAAATVMPWGDGGRQVTVTWPSEAAFGVKEKAVLYLAASADGGAARRAVMNAALAAADAAGRAAADLADRCAALAAEAEAAAARVVSLGRAREGEEADLFTRFNAVLNEKKAECARLRDLLAATQAGPSGEAAPGSAVAAAAVAAGDGVPPTASDDAVTVDGEDPGGAAGLGLGAVDSPPRIDDVETETEDGDVMAA